MKTLRGLLSALALCLLASPAWADKAEFQEFVLQNAAASTTNGTVAGIDRYTSISLDVTISATATVTFEGSVNGTTMTAIACTLSSDGSLASSATTSGMYQCNIAGLRSFQARVSAWTSGTVTVYARASTAIVSKKSSGAGGWPTSSSTKEITWANSLANAVRIGDGVTPICLYTDATLGPQVRPCTDSNVSTIIPTNFNWMLWDVENAAAVETVDPDAASTFAMWTYGAAYRPRSSVWIGAGALSTDGTNCAAASEATPLASGVKLWTIICTDNDSSRMHGSFVLPDRYDGGTITFELTAVQTAASAGNLGWSVAAQCKGDGEVLVATGSYGAEITSTKLMVASSGVVRSTSAAVTPSGTCAAGDFLAFYIDVDATITTTAMATTHIFGTKVEYSTTSRSD